MRNMKTKKVVLASLVVAAGLIALRTNLPGGTLPKVHAQEDAGEGCSLETLRGGYGFTFHGFAGGPPPSNVFIPAAGGGLATFDGNGNLSVAETVSLGGQILPLNLLGTYTVDSDCTGSLSVGSGFTAVHLKIVVVRAGREILAVNSDPGRVAVDNFIKQ